MIDPQTFKYFDPKKGELPGLFADQFKDIAKKARSFLNHRNVDEIDFGLKTIIWIINKRKVNPVTTWILQTGGEDTTVFENPVFYLKDQIQICDISGQALFKKASWQEYFSILALALIGKAKINEHYKAPFTGYLNSEMNKRNRAIVTDCLAKAKEAIGITDSFSESKTIKYVPSEIEKKDKKKTLLRNKNAEIISFNEKRKIKDNFVIFWQSHHFMTKADAAKQYYESLSEMDKKALCNTRISEEAVQALEAHLRKQERKLSQLSTAARTVSNN